MKTKLFLTIALMLAMSYSQWAQPYSASADQNYPYVEVVLNEDRIWLIPDERPVVDLPVKVVDANGEVVLQKLFCSKISDWALDVSTLPAGKYKVLIGANQTEYLEKKGRRWTL